MKQLLLSLFVCSLAGTAAHAATVSGTVTSVATCSPVSGQKVYLRDSLNNNVDSAVTNSSGAYSITFPASWPTPKAYQITIMACGAVSNTPRGYTGANATVNAIICGVAKTLSGTIMLGSTPNTGACKVYLIKVQRNRPIAGDTTLTAVDSVSLTNSPNYSFRMACTPTDTFLVKAVLQPGHPAYANWMPSYDSSLNWSTASRYYGNAFSGMPYYLYMQSGTNPGGTGFIGGSVLAGANKQAGVGDPLAARLMMLVNSTTNKAVGFTYSDATGKFSFPGLAAGTYKLFGDAWGLNNVPLTVVLGGSQMAVSNIIFEEHYGENSFKGRFNSLNIGTVAGPLAGVSVYPNPATKLVSLTGIASIKGAKTLALRNIVGAVVLTREFRDGQAVELAVDALAAGTYILQLTTELGTASFKVVK